MKHTMWLFALILGAGMGYAFAFLSPDAPRPEKNPVSTPPSASPALQESPRRSLADALGVSHFKRMHILYELAADADADALDQLIQEASRIEEIRQDALTVLYSRWLEIDPDAVFDALMAGAPVIGKNKPRELATAVIAIGKINHERAFSLAQSLSPLGARAYAVEGLLSDWIRDDLQAALGWFDALADEDALKRRIAGTMADAVLESDRTKALEIVNTFGVGRGNMMASPKITESLIKHGPVYAMEFAIQSNELALRAAIFGAVAEVDLELAIEYLDEYPPSTSRHYFEERLADRWAEQDPEAAFAWALGINSQRSQFSALAKIVSHWGAANPDAAQRVYQEVPAHAQAKWLTTLAQQRFAQPIDALEWLKAYHTEEAYKDAVVPIVVKWAFQEPEVEVVSHWVQENLDGAAATEAIGHAVEVWVSHDAGAARRFVARLPEGRQKANAARHLLSYSLLYDQDTTIRWVLALPNGITRATAFAYLARQGIELEDP